MRQLSLPTVLFALAMPGCASPAEDADVSAVAVQVVRVREIDLETRLEAPALVHPREQANVASRLTARILQLEVRQGDTVTARQVLAKLEDGDLAARRDEARAAIADAEATLAKLSAGTLPAGLERARGQLAATRAALDQARASYDRRRGLFDQGAIPERDLIASRTELATAEANEGVAGAELRLLDSQTGRRDVEIAQSRLAQAESRLALFETELDFATIRAPFAGTVTAQFLFPGDMAAPDAPLFTVADLSVAVVRAQVPEADTADLRVDQPCALVPADRPEASYAGRVSVVTAAVHPGTRTVEVWCEIPNTNHGLRAGAFGALAITTGAVQGARVVPVAAVQFEDGTRRGLVMVVGEDRTAARRAVDTGPPVDGWAPVLSGLDGGEIVIIQGGYGLPDGTRVEWTGNPE